MHICNEIENKSTTTTTTTTMFHICIVPLVDWYTG